jgi:hypothetical protein
MSDWKTIRIPEDDFERHNEKRQELGLTWAEYINGDVQDYRGTDTKTVEALNELRQELSKGATSSGPVELEASEYSKIAREVVEKLR